MEFKGKYKEWYDRLVKANYEKEMAELRVKKFIEKDEDEVWKNMINKLIEQGKEPNEAIKKVEIIRKATAGHERWEQIIVGIEEGRKLELELLEKAIPKERLENGAWYKCNKEAEHFTRYVNLAQWDEEKEMFRAPGQQQFGMDGWLDHWKDAIDKGYAGFVPMWKVEEE